MKWRWLTVLWCLVLIGCAAAPPTAPQIGQRAPQFTLSSTDGDVVDLVTLRGKPVIVNFFATWCTPCREEMPLLQRAHGSAQVIGIDLREGAPAVRAFGQKQGVSYPLLLDPNGDINELYRVGNLPMTFFIDRDGVLRDVVLGQLREPKLQELLARLDAPPLR